MNQTLKYWRVSDNHAYCRTGNWAKEAIATNTYGMCISPTKGVKETANMTIQLSSGESGRVSKNRYEQASQVSVGDVVYMADTYGGKVYRGIITKETEVFASITDRKSYTARVNERDRREGKKGAKHAILPHDMEKNWDVTWTCISNNLTDEWKAYLHYSTCKTIVQLDGKAGHPE